MKDGDKRFAVWALTPRGAGLARKIAGGLPNADLHLPASVAGDGAGCIPFIRLADAVEAVFEGYGGHVFVMAAGIVVRMIASSIRHKTRDPAVVVVDEAGRFAVSLLSGHIGGANRLAETVSRVTGAIPVITTATDVAGVPAIDVFAVEQGLVIENPEAIKSVNLALLTGKTIFCRDPFGLLKGFFPPAAPVVFMEENDGPAGDGCPVIAIDDRITDAPAGALILRPRSLAAGIGCNRNTETAEIRSLLEETLNRYHLALSSLDCIASIDLKADEHGLQQLAKELRLSLRLFSREELGRITEIPTPSAMVERHVGVKSVCEAAAILAAQPGTLIVSKHSTRNATLAVARRSSIS